MNLSRDLRESRGRFLKNRRGILCLGLVSAANMGLIALYQMGIIRKLPDFGMPRMDSARVNGSSQAYSYFATPDAVLGLVSYAGTIALAAMGPHDRARRHPWMPLAMGAKLGFDAAVALRLTAGEATKYGVYSIWSLAAAAATLAAVPMALPECGEALRAAMPR